MWLQTQVGSSVFQTSPWRLATESRDWTVFPSLASPSLQFENRDTGSRSKITIRTMGNHRTANTVESVPDSTAHAPCKRAGALRIPTTEEAEGGTGNVRLSARGTASPSKLFGKKKKKKSLKRKVEREHKQLYDPWGAALRTGQHCWGHTAGGAQWTGHSWPLG